MKRILYLYRDPPFARFIRDDLDILRERYEVDEVHAEASRVALVKLTHAAARADLIYFWWGDITGLGGALLALLRRKPSLMITGGYDVAGVPEAKYGLRYHPWRKYIPPIVLRLATGIVANSTFSRDGVIRDFGVDPERIVMIPHGLDATSITPGNGPRERRVLTCSILSEAYIPYKGLDTFARAAALLPEVTFVHAGPVAESSALKKLSSISPPNLTIRGFLETPELVEEMRRCTVYAQLSLHEGFGIALAEAMLAGATPVVTRAGAIPEVAGPLAEYVRYGDPEDTAQAILRALDAPRGANARARIMSEFPLERRRRGILSIVESLLDDRVSASRHRLHTSDPAHGNRPADDTSG